MATIAIGTAGGNWSAGATWVGGVAPTAADDVTLAALLTPDVLSIDGTSVAPNLCRSLDATGATGTISASAAKQLNIGDGTTGHFKLVPEITFAANTASVFKFVSTTTGNQLTFGGKAMGLTTFDGVGGEWTFQDAYTGSGSNGITLTNGSLVTNNQTVGANIALISSNANIRSLTLGTTAWTSTGTTGWNIADPTNMTLSAASSTINMSSTTSSSPFAGGGLTYGTLTSTELTTATTTITGNNTFTNLTTSMGATAKTVLSGYVLGAGSTQTVTGTYTANGNTTLLRNFIRSSVVGTPAIIFAATVVATHTDFRDITGAGAGSWDFSGLTTTANGDAGGNTGLTFTAPKNCYAKTAISRSWSEAFWFTTSGGSTAIVPAMPLVHDVAIFDANSVTAGSKTITSDEARHPAMNWTGVANTPAFAHGTLAREFYGSLTLVSGMTHTGTGFVYFRGSESNTLDGGTLTWPTTSIITIDKGAGTLTLARNISSASSIQVFSGTFAMGGYNITDSTGIAGTGGTWNGSGTITSSGGLQATGMNLTLGGTMTLGAAAFALSSGTVDMNNYGITGYTTLTVSSTGVLNLSGQINGSGAITVTGGTINDSGASGELKGTTASFTGGTSTIRKMTLSSTFAMSSTANLTLNPGTYTYVTSWTETGTTKSLNINGTMTEAAGVKTVTAVPVPLYSRIFGGF